MEQESPEIVPPPSPGGDQLPQEARTAPKKSLKWDEFTQKTRDAFSKDNLRKAFAVDEMKEAFEPNRIKREFKEFGDDVKKSFTTFVDFLAGGPVPAPAAHSETAAEPAVYGRAEVPYTAIPLEYTEDAFDAEKGVFLVDRLPIGLRNFLFMQGFTPADYTNREKVDDIKLAINEWKLSQHTEL